MYRNKFKNRRMSSIKVCEAYIAEPLESKIFRMTQNKEPIGDGADIIYQERADGIEPSFDIRTDKWEHMVDRMDTEARKKLSKREERIEAAKKAKEEGNKTDDRKVDNGAIPRPGGTDNGAGGGGPDK